MTDELDLRGATFTLRAWRNDITTVVATLPVGFDFSGRTWTSRVRRHPDGALVSEQTVTVDTSARTLTIPLDFTGLSGAMTWQVRQHAGGPARVWWTVPVVLGRDTDHV